MNSNSNKRPVTKKRKVVRKSIRQRSALVEQMKNAITLTSVENIAIRHNMIISLLLVVMTVCTLLAILGYINKPIVTKYIIADDNGQIAEQMYDGFERMSDPKNAAARVDVCLRDTLNLNFQHWKKDIAAADGCYTTKGYSEFLTALDNQGIIRDITNISAVASLEPVDPMRMTGQATDTFGKPVMRFEGNYNYKLIHSTGKPNSKRTISYSVTITVVTKAVPYYESSHGYLIGRAALKVNGQRGVQ